MRKIATALLRATVLPYVRREWPGWGHLHRLFLDYRRDWLWKNVEPVEIKLKDSGYCIRVHPSEWQDRTTFALRRWHDSRLMSFAKEYIKAGSTVVDVGANRGYFSLFAASLNSNVIAFEPNPAMVERLVADISRNGIRNIEVSQIALGAVASSMALHIPDYNSGEASLGQIDRAKSIMVQILPGDSTLAGTEPCFVKIDVEGFETEVIKGMQGVISRCRPIIAVEIVRRHLERCGTSPEELVSLLSSNGYNGYALGLRGVEYTLEPLDLGCPAFDSAWLPAKIS